jgi:hypothetical protein
MVLWGERRRRETAGGELGGGARRWDGRSSPKRPSGLFLARFLDWEHAREHTNLMEGLVRDIGERSGRVAVHGGAAAPAS